MPKTPADWHSPLKCPRCEAETGHPFSVESKSSQEVTVSVRCGACAHQWELVRETPTFALKTDPRLTGDEHAPD
jgi:hypothetical protein